MAKIRAAQDELGNRVGRRAEKRAASNVPAREPRRSHCYHQHRTQVFCQDARHDGQGREAVCHAPVDEEPLRNVRSPDEKKYRVAAVLHGERDERVVLRRVSMDALR